MTRNSLPTHDDEPVEHSAFLAFAALAVAVVSLFGPMPFNGLSLVAVILLILSIACRVVESHRRDLAACTERHDHE